MITDKILTISAYNEGKLGFTILFCCLGMIGILGVLIFFYHLSFMPIELESLIVISVISGALVIHSGYRFYHLNTSQRWST